jgi:hypothetical protein
LPEYAAILGDARSLATVTDKAGEEEIKGKRKGEESVPEIPLLPFLLLLPFLTT